MLMTKGLMPAVAMCGEPLSIEDGLPTGGAFAVLSPECRDGHHGGRGRVAALDPHLPVRPVAVVEPFLGFYEDMRSDGRVGQFVQCEVHLVVRDERTFESPRPLARISIPAQERFAMLVEFDPGEQVLLDPPDSLAVEAADRPLPQFSVE